MTPPAPGKGVALDPFGHFPELVSRIDGLTPDAGVEDANYAFHTPYVGTPPGTARFRISFDNLRADGGTLSIFINELGYTPEQVVNTVEAMVLPFKELVHLGGEQVLRFQTRPDRTYAALAGIYDEADASADGLRVVLEHVDDEEEEAGQPEPAERSVGRQVARLVSDSPPTLAEPTSQRFTPAQLDEPACRRWAKALGMTGRRRSDHWEAAYAMQVFTRSGSAAPGARGLGLGVGAQPVPSALAAAGCEVVAADHAPGLDHNAGEPGVDGVHRRAFDMGAVPRDLARFDFAWLPSALRHFRTVEEGVGFLEAGLLCLKPGGLMVATVAFDPEPTGVSRRKDGAPALDRRRLERLCLSYLALGHEVAQLRYGPPEPPSRSGERPLGAFGLIVRRRRTIGRPA